MTTIIIHIKGHARALEFIYNKAIQLNLFPKGFPRMYYSNSEGRSQKRKPSYMSANLHCAYSGQEVARGTDASRIPKVIKSDIPITNTL